MIDFLPKYPSIDGVNISLLLAVDRNVDPYVVRFAGFMKEGRDGKTSLRYDDLFDGYAGTGLTFVLDPYTGWLTVNRLFNKDNGKGELVRTPRGAVRFNLDTEYTFWMAERWDNLAGLIFYRERGSKKRCWAAYDKDMPRWDIRALENRICKLI